MQHTEHGTLESLTQKMTQRMPIYVGPCDEICLSLCRYDSGGAAAGVTTLTSGGGGGGKADRRITLAMIKDEGMGAGGATSWVQVWLHCVLKLLHIAPSGLCVKAWLILRQHQGAALSMMHLHERLAFSQSSSWLPRQITKQGVRVCRWRPG